MAQLENGSQLLNAFGNIEEAGFISPVMLNDTKVGFSVQKQYPNNIRFKPAKTAQGEDDDIAVIWVVYDVRKQKEETNLVNLHVNLTRVLH